MIVKTQSGSRYRIDRDTITQVAGVESRRFRGRGRLGEARRYRQLHPSSPRVGEPLIIEWENGVCTTTSLVTDLWAEVSSAQMR